MKYLSSLAVNFGRRFRTMSYKPQSVESKWSSGIQITTVTAQNGQKMAIQTPGFHPEKYVNGDMYDDTQQRDFINPVFYVHQGFMGYPWSSEPGGRNWDNDAPVLEETWMKQMPTDITSQTYVFTRKTWPFSQTEYEKLKNGMKQVSLVLPLRIRPDGTPVRTGISGRGVLGRFGPNGAADPIMVRWKYMRDPVDRSKLFLVDGNPVICCDKKLNPVLQVVIIKRKKGRGEFALPGGMNTTPDGKIVPVSMTLANEYAEETCGVPEDDAEKTDEHKAMVQKILDYVEANGIEIYSGPVGDPRDTDNAWMNTTATIIPDWEPQGGIFDAFKHESGSDASGVFVIDWSPLLKRKMYASHGTMIDNAYDVMRFLKHNKA